MTEHSNDKDNQTLTMGFSIVGETVPELINLAIVGETAPELIDFAMPPRIYTVEEMKHMILAELYFDHDSL